MVFDKSRRTKDSSVREKMYEAYLNAQTSEWRKLYNDELQCLFQRPNIL